MHTKSLSCMYLCMLHLSTRCLFPNSLTHSLSFYSIRNAFGFTMPETPPPPPSMIKRSGSKKQLATPSTMTIPPSSPPLPLNKAIKHYTLLVAEDEEHGYTLLDDSSNSLIGLTNNNSQSNEAPSTTTTDACRSRRVNFADNEDNQSSQYANDISKLKSFSKTIGKVVTGAVQGLASKHGESVDNVQGLASKHGESVNNVQGLASKHGKLVDIVIVQQTNNNLQQAVGTVGKLADTVTNHKHHLHNHDYFISPNH